MIGMRHARFAKMAVFSFTAFGALYAFRSEAVEPQSPKPLLAPGQWEIVVTESLTPSESVTGTRCIGPEAIEAKILHDAHAHALKLCQFSPVKRTPKLIEYSVTCPQTGGLVATSAISFSGDFAKEFEEIETISFNMPTPIPNIRHSKRYRFLGDCRKGWKPGDIMIVSDRNGRPGDKWNRYEYDLRASKKTK
jgi:hypothetical protein